MGGGGDREVGGEFGNEIRRKVSGGRDEVGGREKRMGGRKRGRMRG